MNQLRLSGICAMLTAMGKLSTNWRQWVNRGRSLLFPPVCHFCQEPMPEAGCCRQCLAGIQVWSLSVCEHCGRVLPPEMVPGPCGRCLRSPLQQQRTISLFSYRDGVRSAILKWKLGGDDAAVRWLLHTSESRIREIFQPDDLLLPVPMPLSRMRKSGQHHAADLARMIAGMNGCRHEWRLLRREGEQARQSALSSSQRQRNLRKSFHIDSDYWRSIEPELPAGGRLWVVDDILTTGATMRYACRALRPLGRPVHAFSLARTPLQQ